MRNPAWALDSVERLTRKNPLEPSGLFKFDPGGTVYSRAEGLMSGTGMIGYGLNALRDAVFDPDYGRMLLVRFETLIADPAKVLAAIYDFVGLPAFAHDFANIAPDYDAMMFDARIGAPGLHAVGSRIPSPPPRHRAASRPIRQSRQKRVLGSAERIAGRRAYGELAALVRVEDFRLPKARQHFLQCIDAEAGVHGVRQFPCQHLPGRPVHDRDQVQKTPSHRDVCDVRAPDVVGPHDCQLAKKVRINPMLRIWITGPGPRIDRCQTHLGHQPSGTTAANLMAIALQVPAHLTAAIPRAVHEHRIITAINASVSSVAGTGT